MQSEEVRVKVENGKLKIENEGLCGFKNSAVPKVSTLNRDLVPHTEIVKKLTIGGRGVIVQSWEVG